MKTFIFLAVAVIAQAVGNTCLSKGMKTLAAATPAIETLSLGLLVDAMGTPLIWVGILCLILFFGCFTALLSWADLSFVLPASSAGYILNVAFASYFLGEPVSATRWAGTFLIVVGVVLVSRSAAERQRSLLESGAASNATDA